MGAAKSSTAKALVYNEPVLDAYVITSAGVRMPRLIYGTAWKKERTTELVKLAVRQGFRGIDTACQPKHYSEDLVGQALEELAQEGFTRDSLFVQTKYTPFRGQDPDRVPYDPKQPLPVQVAQSWDTTTRNLRTQYVDSLVLHSPLESYTDTLSVWRAMEELVDQNKALQLGISNAYELDLLQKLYQDAAVKPAVIQNRFYSDTNHDSDIRAWCKENGIQYQSFWTLTANREVPNDPGVQAICAAKGRTPQQVFFRFVLQQGICPLTGTTDEGHMLADLGVFEFELTAEEVDTVAKATFG